MSQESPGDSNCSLDEPPPLVELRVREVSSNRLSFEVANHSGVRGQVKVVGTSFGDKQVVRTDAVVADLKIGETSFVVLSPKALRLAKRTMIRGGRVQFTVHARFEDGRLETAAGPELYYALDQKGVARLSASPDLLNNAYLTSDGVQLNQRAGNSLKATDMLNVALESAGADPFGDDGSPGEMDHEGPGQPAPLIPHQSVTKTLCFNIVTQFTDAGIGEDTYRSADPSARQAIGNRIRIGTTTIHPLSSGALATLGCKTATFPTGTLSYRLYSNGTVAGRYVDAYDEDLNSGFFDGTIAVSSSTATQTFTLDPTARVQPLFNIYQAAALAVRNHPGIGTGGLNLRHAGGSSFFSSSTKVVTIKADGSSSSVRKFTIGHEVGHWLLDDSGARRAADSSLNDSYCPTATGSTDNNSLEHQSGAFDEGFATFVGMDAFNHHDELDGFARHELDNIDAQNETPGLPIAVAETLCDDTPPSNPSRLTGKGNETDWVRVLWNLHTDTPQRPTMNGLLEWFIDSNRAKPWTRSNIHSSLNWGAVGKPWVGSWDNLRSAHGVDH